ncbi:MAG: efflux RND transporter periplasmic adaptor subunit [Verrucomicrobiales bacterium]
MEEATLTLKQELARAEQAERDWKKLGGQAEGAGAELARRVPQVAAARAHEASMRAAVAKAELDLERTRIVAPYDGRVLDRQADVGFFAAPGTPLGELYSTGIFEVTLPLAPDQFAQLAITLGFDAARQGVEGPPVALAGMFGGTLHDWQGTVARTGGAIDAQTRTVPVVVEVRDEPAAGRPPLAPGMFMRAKVGGVTEENLSPIPRSSLLGDSRVLVVDKENKLQFREVEVAQKTDDEALIRSGFQGGDRVCLTVLDDAVSGMEVAVLNAEPAAAPQL